MQYVFFPLVAIVLVMFFWKVVLPKFIKAPAVPLTPEQQARQELIKRKKALLKVAKRALKQAEKSVVASTDEGRMASLRQDVADARAALDAAWGGRA